MNHEDTKTRRKSSSVIPNGCEGSLSVVGMKFLVFARNDNGKLLRVFVSSWLIFFTPVFLSACNGGKAYTLYRDSIVGESGESARVHVATFDSIDGEEYNRRNCDIAKNLFQEQPGVETKFWCEKGRYRS